MKSIRGVTSCSGACSRAAEGIQRYAIAISATAAATDFHTQHPAHTIYFRNVRIGRVMTLEGEKQYILCGQFLPARAKDKADWTPFVAIKTSGYEKWLGDQAARFCKRSSIIWDKGDLSSSLQSRFDSLQ